jgi:hypothetical protein
VLLEQLTPERVAAQFRHRAPSQVQRFLLPAACDELRARRVLDGGVNDALNLDAHGKALSFLLLDMPFACRARSCLCWRGRSGRLIFPLLIHPETKQ